MSTATSPGAGRVYGVERVCAVWGVARSSFYADKHKRTAGNAKPCTRPAVLILAAGSEKMLCERNEA